MRPAPVLLAWLALAGCCGSAFALEPFAPSEAELRQLPAYCVAKLTGRGPEYERWKAALGPGFVDLHHHCFGLNFLARYHRSRDARERSYNLQLALNNFDYMVTHEKPGFSLMWEVYLKRGYTYFLMKRPGQAIADLAKAAALNPHASQVYLTWADVLEATNAREQALGIVIEGLRQVPESTALKRRYEELGGKPPYPEPYSRAEVTRAPVPAPAVASQPPPPVETVKGEIRAQETGGSPAAAAPVGDERGARPWCRFCPDQ